jgi:hypothetical protein
MARRMGEAQASGVPWGKGLGKGFGKLGEGVELGDHALLSQEHRSWRHIRHAILHQPHALLLCVVRELS